MIENLQSDLYKGVCGVNFIKKNGEKRYMLCTTNYEYGIPEDQYPKGVQTKKNDDVIKVFDLDKNDWRSFRKDSVKSYCVKEN